MKKSFVASLVMIGLILTVADSAFATATNTTLASASISADTAATNGSGAYTTLTGPVLKELSNRDITNGTIVLTVSTNFQFNSAATVSVAVSRNSGLSNLVGLSSGTAIVTTSNITITVTNQDGLATTTSILTWSGIQVRPLLGTPLATNTITMASNSTAKIVGITNGVTRFGQLSETLGAANKLGYTTVPAATNTAGVALTNVAVQVQDRFGNTVSSNNVAVALALNTGTFASGNTNANTGAGGSATFSNLVIDTAGSYTLTASAAATSLSNSPPTAFTVVAAAPSALQILQDAPSSIFAGVTFPSPVTVQVADPFGNLISNKTVNLSLLSGATLSGTTSQPSGGNGVATFGGLSVTQAGSQSLVASISSPSLSVTGTAFTVNAGFASQLGYTVAPAATTTAGVTMASISVQIQDQAGNPIASNGVPITVTLNTGAFASGDTIANTGDGGSATFSNLVINTAGNYTLTASAAATSLSNSPPSAFIVVAAAPSTIQITQDAPPSTTAGTVFSPAVTVLVTDSLNNPITNKTVTLTLNGGGTLNGTTSQVTVVNGVASFANLNITVPGANYSLTAAISNPSLSVTGNPFAVTTAAASKLVYTLLPPASTVAGATLTPFTVQVADQFNNSIATNGVLITMSLTNGIFASGTTSSNSDVNGSATFTNLVITAAGNNTLIASATGLTSANTALVILPTAYAITFQQDAPSPATAGVTFSPPVAVRIADQYSNVLSNATVTLNLLGGGAPGGSTVRTTAVNGVASFTNLFINTAGTNYALVANSVNSLSVTGATFTVNTASASKLVFTSVPAITNIAGAPLTNFAMQIQDQFNNNVLTNGVLITMTLSNGAFASGSTTTNTDSNGSATISDLVITNAGSNTVTASVSGLTSTNKPLVILPAPFAITFQQDAPAVTNAGAFFTPPVAVKIADQYNNFLTNKAVMLTLLPTNLFGVSTVRTTAVNGVASFTNLFIKTAGTNYALVATATNSLSVLSVTGNTFTVTAAAATNLIFTSVPAVTNVAGAPLTNFVMQITDQFTNSVATNGVLITMTLSNGTFASGTTTTNTDSNGSATISDLVITAAGSNRVIASSAGLISTNKIVVILPAPFAITFQQDAPSVTNAGAVFSPAVAVRIADQYNNFLTNRAVTMTLLGGSFGSGSTLASTTAVNGVASFTNLFITVPGNNYALVANSTNSLSVTGHTFAVTNAAPSKLVYTTLPPLTNTAGVVLSTFVVQIEDQYNNSIATNGVPIAVGLNTGSFASGTINQTSDLGGKATFFDLYIDTIGTYTLSASSTGLAPVAQLVTIVPTNASSIAFIQQPPVSVTAGATFSPAVTVKVTDQYTNAIAGLPVILSLNGGGSLNGTTSQVTSASGVATFNNLSVNQPGTGHYLTAITTNPALSVNSTNFNVNVGALDHYLVTASSPQMRGSNFTVTVTAQDVVSNTIPDSSTVVTMSGSTANVLFDGSGDNSFTNNTHILNNGTFTINTVDAFAENITITAKDASNRTGSASVVVTAAGGDYRSATNGNWSVAGTWQVWSGTSWVSTNATPAGGAGTNITIQSVHMVTNNVAVGLTGTLFTQGSLNFSGSGAVTVGTGGIVRNSGTINSSGTTLIFNSGGTYQHAYTNASGMVPTSTWNSNSTCAIVGYTTFSGNPTGFAQSFNNFVWNCPNQSAPISAAGALTTVNGDFTIANTGSGSFQGSSNAVFILTVAGSLNIQGGTFVPSFAGNTNLLKIGGSFVQTGGTFSQGTGTLTLNFTGANKTFTQSGGTFNNFNVNFAVTNGASLTLNNSLSVSNGQSFTVFNSGTLNCGTNVVSGAGTFALNSGGALGVGSTGGLTSSGAMGNVQTTTRTFSTGGIYIYNGSASQAAGIGLPGTVSSLIVSNTGGIVTLGSNVSVTSNLTVSAGVFDLGSFIANRASNGGTVTVANSATLKIGGTNTFPTNYVNRVLGSSSAVEYEGSAQSVPALAYGNLNTSGSGIKTLLAGPTTLAGDLNIGAGTTFNAVTNSFSIAGNLTNNGTAFSFSGPQTVAFTGSGTQNVAGASSIAFNTFAITNSASVINLGNNDTALEFTIAGLDQAGGTWGATGSGAVNTNDTNFGGTGTLNVTPPTFNMTFLQDAPAVTNAGAVFSPPVTVQLTSSATNLIVNKMVTLTLNGGTLNGPAQQLTDTNGVATFTNLSINVSGNYSLTATIANPALSVTGNVFTVTAATSTKLVYTSVPATTNIAGSTLSSFTVQLEDPFTNNVLTSGVPITMSLSSGTFASGTTTIPTAGGSATFSNLVVTATGNNTLTASSTNLTSASRAITIIPDIANSTLTFVQGPPTPSVTAGSVFTNTVKLVDEFNNGISNATVTLSPNGFATLNGTTSHVTAANGVATFNNLSINTAGSNYFITATSGSLSNNSSLFNVTVGGIHHYLVSAATPQTRGVAFGVTVTAQDAVSNTVPDNSTVVTMSGSTANVQFDSNGDSTFGDNTQVLSNGTFTISTEDNLPETITITASDANGRNGTSPAIVINAAAGDYRSNASGPWNTAGTWQIWDGANWATASTPPAGGAGTNITVLSSHTVTDNAPVALTGTLITQGSLTFSSGSLAVGSGGLVLNSGAVTNSSASTLIFNSGSTYQHGRDGGTIPTAAYNSNSLLRVTGITATVAKLPTNGVNGNVEWNCPNQTAVAAIFLAVSAGATQSIGGDFTIVSTGTGSIIGGGGTARNLSVGGNLNVQGGTYHAIGGGGDSSGNVSVNVAHDLTVNGGNYSMVFATSTASSVSGVLTVGGNLAVNGGTLTILTGNASTASTGSFMTVSGNTSITGGILNLTDATSGNPTGVIAALEGDLVMSGGTISRGGTLPATVSFAGTSPETYSKSAGTITGAVNFAILSGATVNFGTSPLDGSSGTFTLNSGGTIGIGDPLGITTSGASGNIRVSGTRTYNTGANYIYNGPASQVTSNGLPATVNSLTVSNTGGIVTLGSNVSVTSNLTVSLGTFDLGNFIANRASNGGTITVANNAALKVGGTNTFPTNYVNRVLGPSSTVEYEGSAQSVPALAYGSLVTSGSGTKTLLAGTTTIASNLTIRVGTTFAAGTNSFSIAGDWSNNGSFTATNTQTVTFNGSSPQTIDGSLATAFNNVVINSSSVLNLAINGSTAQLLSIGGTNQLAGTWGTSASGATHPDDTDFQGIFTLNVLSASTASSTTTVATSGSPSTYGQSVTFTATVTGTGPTPSGTVTFMAGANTLGTQTLSGSPTGTAAVVTSGLYPGSYTITAVYSGDANFFASSNSVAQQVDHGSLNITANSTSKTYGDPMSFAGTEFTSSGLTNGDTVTSVTLTSDGAAANAPAGNHSIIPSAPDGTGLTNYNISYQNGALTVNQRGVTGSITATNKVYDGTTAATISSYSLSVVLFGDDATLTGGTANFSDKNVGNGKSVTATGLTLTGTAAGNYSANTTASASANITPATLTASADNKSRPFGQVNPPLTASYSGFGTGDSTNVLFGAPNLTTTADTNSPVASYPIFITAGSLSAANYSFAFTNGTLTVTKAILTVTADDQSRPYGATNPVFTATFSGFLNGDTNTVVSGDPAFSTTADTNSPVAGNPYSITVTNGTLTATNYDFAFVDGQLIITPATVSGSITASNKVYDGTTAATIASYALSGVIGTDDVTLTGGTANFIDQNVGIGKLVTATGLTLSGTTTGNYTLASSTTNTTADITAYPLTVTAATNTKSYDGTNTAAASPSITVGTPQNTDTATLSETYDTKNVGIGKTLTPTASINDGNGGTNYFVTYVSDTTGVITSLTLTGSITASNKVYDGTIAATISSYSLSGALGLDDVHLTGGTANFIDQNVGTGKSVTAIGLTLNGTAAGNYTVNTTANATADITPAPLTIIADNKTKTAGLPNPTLTATYVSFVSGDGTNSLATLPTLSTTAIDSSPAGTYSITASGAVATNYTISYSGGTLTVVGVPQITNTKVSGNQFIFSFPTLLYEEYQVEYKDDLSAPTWTSLGSLIDGTGNSVTVTNAIIGTKRFYRVEVSPGN